MARPTAAVAILAASLITAGLGGQSKPPAAQQQPVFRAGVNFVRVDVYPTSKDGQHVGDLTADDFEVIENNVPQKIATFEHVLVRRQTSEQPRVDPRTIDEEHRAVADRNNRLFVLFLDTYHVTDPTPDNILRGRPGDVPERIGLPLPITKPLIDFLDRTLGPDDLVALMTPDIDVRRLVFVRRSDSIAKFLESNWARRSEGEQGDVRERLLRAAVGREQGTLHSLRELIAYLGDLREDRKAVVLITEGWMLPRPGDESDFRDLLDRANRANVSFYPVDPRGLATRDGGPPPPPGKDTGLDTMREALKADGLSPARIAEATSLAGDQAALGIRLETMKTLAEATDGAMMLSNDLDRVLQRVADDLSAYYLLGYNSTNAKPDGSYRRLTVKVKRPGVDVRARRGYRAATPGEVAVAAAPPEEPSDPEADAARAAVASLLAVGEQVPFVAEAGQACTLDAASHPAIGFWIVGELTAAGGRDAAWAAGAGVTVSLADGAGRAMRTDRAEVNQNKRTFLLTLPPALEPGEYSARVVAQAAGSSAVPVSQLLRATIAGAADRCVGAPVFFRRGPFTGPAYQPTADPRFKRQERVRLEVPVSGAVESFTAQLLDRAGKPLAVPVATTERQDGSTRWLAAELALAPLAPGDYVMHLEIAAGATREKVLRAFRIVP